MFDVSSTERQKTMPILIIYIVIMESELLFF